MEARLTSYEEDLNLLEENMITINTNTELLLQAIMNMGHHKHKNSSSIISYYEYGTRNKFTKGEVACMFISPHHDTRNARIKLVEYVTLHVLETNC
jgi:hypothetical protein